MLIPATLKRTTIPTASIEKTTGDPEGRLANEERAPGDETSVDQLKKQTNPRGFHKQ